jgi:glycosyltransferase involved in cell wall biosynthesis
MTTRRQTANDDTLFWTLKLIQDNPSITQRSLAKEVGINVSSINFCLKALAESGWIKVGNFSKNPDKLSYLCKVRDAGDLAEKMDRMLSLSHEQRTEMGLRGRAKMEAEFDEQIVIKKYLAAIDGILSPRAA